MNIVNKKFYLLIMLGCCLVNTVFATKSVYLGTVIGETDNNFVSSDLGINSADIRYQGFSGRYFLGFNFSNTFGMEGSWLHVHKIGVLNINNSSKNGEIDVNVYGILARFGIDVSKSQQLFLKFGGAYMRAEPDNNVRESSNNDYSRATVSHWRPVIEVGIVRRFYKYFDFGVVLHYVAEHRALPKATLIGFNLSVNLDRYTFSRSKSNSMKNVIQEKDFKIVPPPPR